MTTQSAIANPIKPISIADDWFITQAFVFPEHFSSAVNLSEELINCVQIEQDEYDQLLHDYRQALEVLKLRDQQISDRLVALQDCYEQWTKTNHTKAAQDLLHSHTWNRLHHMTDELGSLCCNMIDAAARGTSEPRADVLTSLRRRTAGSHMHQFA